MSDTDSISVSRLICLVRERPVLWDRQEEVYKNRKLTRKAWAEICEALIDNYDELSELDKKAVGRNVIGKWANLRDNWLRYWRKRQDMLRRGSSTRTIKKYIHHDQLLFLSKVYDPDQELQGEVEEIQVDVDIISDPEVESPLGLSYEETSELSQSMWNFGQDEIPPDRTQVDPQPEPHAYFFHSIMPLIYNFNEDQILAFHTAVLECVRRVKYNANFPLQSIQLMQVLPYAQEAVATKEDFLRRFPKNTNTTDHPFNPLQQIVIRKEPETRGYSCELKTLPVQRNEQIPSSSHKTEGKPSTEPKSTQLPTEEPDQKCDLRDLKDVVERLERISKKLKRSSIEDSFDKFGKYISTLLRKIAPRKVQLLKKKLVRDVLRAKLSHKRQRSKNSQRKLVPDVKFEINIPKDSLDSNIRRKVSSADLPSNVYSSNEDDIRRNPPCGLPSVQDVNSNFQETISSSTPKNYSQTRAVLLHGNISASIVHTCSNHSVNHQENDHQNRANVTSSSETQLLASKGNKAGRNKRQKT